MAGKFGKITIVVAVALLASFSAWQLVKDQISADTENPSAPNAFPSCEGYGCSTTGGRGGQVYAVTNLDDSGEGSLRWAVGQGTDSDKRIVVFKVAGVIELNSPVAVKPNTTIAGQTAPGDGVALTAGLAIRDNTIARYLRIRPKTVKSDGIEIVGYNNVIDHCSISWPTDEAVGIKRNQPMDTTEPPIARNLTVQWSIFSEAEKGILGWFAHQSSIHHNLFAHNDYRTPVTSGTNSTGNPSIFDVRNNVIYDIGGEGATAQGDTGVNFVGNFAKLGNPKRKHIYTITVKPAPDPSRTKIFLEANQGPHMADGEPEWNEVRDTAGATVDEATHRASEPFQTPYVTTYSAEEAYTRVLASAGASLPKRDSYDSRIIDDVHNTGNTGTYPRGWEQAQVLSAQQWPSLSYSSAEAPLDTDNDGMPDEWELSKGLDPNDSSDSSDDFSGNGYTNIEEYINELSGSISSTPVAPANKPPTITNIGDKTSTVKEEISFIIEGIDEDGDKLTYSSETLPEGATLDESNGLFSWTPEEDQIGSHLLTFTVSDGKASANESIKITVDPMTKEVPTTNKPPTLSEIENKEVEQGKKIEFTLQASDPDGDTLTYSSNSLPIGALLDSDTGEFEWIPTENQSGEFTISFDVSDETTVVSKTMTITVNKIQSAPPVLSPIGNKTISTGQLLTFKVNADDPDSNDLFYSVTILPLGSRFDPSTQTFSWTPTSSQAGLYFISFSVSDGLSGDYEIVEITVNKAPSIATPTPISKPTAETSPETSLTPTPAATQTSTVPEETWISTEPRTDPPQNTKVERIIDKSMVKLVRSPEEKKIINSGISEILLVYKEANIPSHNLIDVNYYRLLEKKKFDPVVKISKQNADNVKSMELVVLGKGKQLIRTTLSRQEDESAGSKQVQFLANDSISFDVPGVYQLYLKVDGQETIGMVKNCLVDPAGYIYYVDLLGKEVKVEGSTVRLLEKDEATYTDWNAAEFGQSNPQTTAEDGKYSFLVPPGIYKVTVEKSGFKNFTSEPIKVDYRAVIKNIELEKEISNIIIIGSGALIAIITLTIALIVRKRKRALRDNLNP